jgi:hypothetical protein
MGYSGIRELRRAINLTRPPIKLEQRAELTAKRKRRLSFIFTKV